jgi:hypothetical protein
MAQRARIGKARDRRAAGAVDIRAHVACDAAMRRSLAAAVSFVPVLFAAACQTAPTPSPAEDAARAEALAVVDAVYAAVSGPKGATKDPQGLLALFVPDGRVTLARTATDGTAIVSGMTATAFANLIVRNSTLGSFYETPIQTRIEVFGGLATAWSSFTARLEPDARPYARGINSFQLVRTMDGWRIVSIAWHEETATTKLPADMDVAR